MEKSIAGNAITAESVAALIRKSRLDGAAAGEMLKWADEHLKDIVKNTGDLERKMQIMLVADLAVLYLLFRAGGVPASGFALAWNILLLGAWGSAVAAMSFLVAGLLVATEYGLRGDRPVNWSVEYLTLPENGESENRDYILGYLCAKYSDKIKSTQGTHDRKLRLYKRGFKAHCALLSLLGLAAFFRILEGMPL